MFDKNEVPAAAVTIPALPCGNNGGARGWRGENQTLTAKACFLQNKIHNPCATG